MKIAFIFVLFKTPEFEIKRLRKEIEALHVPRYTLYFVDNTKDNRGYASGVNTGLKKAIKDGCDLFVLANPDISLSNFKGKSWLKAKENFDIWGYAMNQEGKIYYGGEIDKWRMSGGLIDEKPKKIFQPVDFVSGSLMVLTKQVIDKIGFLDESYFLYYEEVDYCFRAKKSNFRVGIDSSIVYDHFEVSKENPKKNYFLFKNRLKFLFKYGSLIQKTREILRSPKTVFEEIIKRPFYLNFFSLNISSLINKFLYFVLFLIMIKTFPPEEYAVYTLAWTHVGLLLPLLDFGTTSYGLVYLPSQKIDSSSTLFSLRLSLSIVTLILTLFSAVILHYPPKVFSAIVLTSIVIIANAFSGSFLIFSSVKGKSYFVAVSSMIFQFILVLILISLTFFSKNISLLFWAVFFSYGIYALVNLFLIIKFVKKLFFKIDLYSWMKILKKSLIFLLLGLLAGTYSKLDVFLLNFLKGPKEVGIYSSGYKFLDALMFIITAYNVSSMPIFSRFVEEKNKSLFLLKVKKDILLVILIGGIIAFGIYFFSPIFLPIVMRGDYRSAIPVIRIIIFSLPLILLTSIAINGIYALKKAKTILYLFVFQLIFNFTFNYLLIPRYGYFASAWITVTGEILNVLVTFIILRKAFYENFG